MLPCNVLQAPKMPLVLQATAGDPTLTLAVGDSSADTEF